MVLVIVTILASIATPSFNQVVMKSAVKSAAVELLDDIRFARSEAIRRSTGVSICSLAAGSLTACSAGTAAWANGWIVFVDSASSGTLSSTADILRVHQPSNNIASIQSTNPASDHPSFTFFATGRAKLPANQTFIITPIGSVSSSTTRLICISNQGRTVLRAQGDSQCG